MNICGIICEYNPFHNGHRRLIDLCRAEFGADSAVVCVMSGDFVQRGEAAAFPKHDRARAAVAGGADLVLELPLPWCMAPAETFARGAVGLLGAAGIVTRLCFGSECGDLPLLRKTARSLLRQEMDALIRGALETGVSYAASRQNALEALGAEIRASSGDVRWLNDLKRFEPVSADPIHCDLTSLCFRPDYTDSEKTVTVLLRAPAELKLLLLYFNTPGGISTELEATLFLEDGSEAVVRKEHKSSDPYSVLRLDLDGRSCRGFRLRFEKVRGILGLGEIEALDREPEPPFAEFLAGPMDARYATWKTRLLWPEKKLYRLMQKLRRRIRTPSDRKKERFERARSEALAQESAGDPLIAASPPPEAEAPRRVTVIQMEAGTDPVKAAAGVTTPFVYFRDPRVSITDAFLEEAASAMERSGAQLLLFGGKSYEKHAERSKTIPVKSIPGTDAEEGFSSEDAKGRLFLLSSPVWYNRMVRTDLLRDPLLLRNGSELYRSSLLLALAFRILVKPESSYTLAVDHLTRTYKSCAYYTETLESLDALYDALLAFGAPEEILHSFREFAVSLLAPALNVSWLREARMALYGRLQAFLDKTALLDRPEAEYGNKAGWKKLKGTDRILEADALVKRRERAPDCALVKAAGTADEPLVSVIVPVYNVEPYLQACLESLRGQTLREIEIICVNDGSTDGSLACLLAAAEADPRISVYTQANGGQSSARNAGVRAARGKYL